MNGNCNNASFSFFRFPAELMRNSKYKNISSMAKILLCMIMDRMRSSVRNAERFTHSDGRIYVIFTVEEIRECFGCGKTRAVSIVNELIENGFIEKIRCGQGKPNRIFLSDSFEEFFNEEFLYSHNETSRSPESELQEIPESYPNQNNNKQININQNNFNHSICAEDYDRVVEELEEQIEADCFVDNADIVREIVYLMADILTSCRAHMRIGGASVDMSLVRKRFAMLNSEHIEYIIGNLNNSETKIRNVRSYLISLLYNAPTCMASSVSADFGYYFKNGGN